MPCASPIARRVSWLASWVRQWSAVRRLCETSVKGEGRREKGRARGFSLHPSLFTLPYLRSLNMYYIVTGAAGFIGSNLVKDLNERGENNIIAVDNMKNADRIKNLVA